MTISTATHRQRRIPWRRSSFYGSLFVFPYVCFLLLFGAGPALYAIYISFNDPASDAPRFTGIANYLTAFRDFRFGSSFLNIGIYLAIWLPVMVIGVLLLALLLHQRPGPFSTGMRLIYYLPGAVVGSAGTLLWLFMFDPAISPFAPILHLLGLHALTDTLYEPHVPVLLTIIAFTSGAGGWIVLMYGALQNIPREMIEAARIDGCNAWQMAFFIKLPTIAKYVIYMLILLFAGGTQLFVEPTLLARASSNLIKPTWAPNQLAYTFAFELGNLGSSAALSIVLLMIGLVGAYLIVFRTRFFEIDATKGK